MEKKKNIADSLTMMSEIVLPNHTNPLRNLMGGQLLYWMDICAGIVSQRHANRVCVTASVDSVEFRHPIKLGDVVILEGKVNRAFTSSMEIEINVWAENPRTSRRIKSNKAFYTMVALDEDFHPVGIPELTPETAEEKESFDAAARRRQVRLLLAGRIQIGDANELMEYINATIDKKNP